MFKDIGKKIKGLAIVVFALVAISAFIASIVFADYTDGFSLLLGLAGILLAWISSWGLYGFGEIIDKLTDIERNTRGMNPFGVQPTYTNVQPTYTNNTHPVNTNYVQPMNANYTQPVNANYTQPIAANYAQPVNTNYAQPMNANYTQPINTQDNSNFETNQAESIQPKA